MSQQKTQKKYNFEIEFYEKYSSSRIFEYRSHEKIKNALLVWGIGLSMVLIVLIFYIFLPQDSFMESYLGKILGFFLDSIKEKTKMGLFLTSSLGGLFFLVFPLEIYFINLVWDSIDPVSIYVPYVFGIITAQCLNFWFGMYANRFCKILIPPQNFYKWKGGLNRWGVWMILAMNMLPLPSPVFSTVLGAFRYNPKRFFLFMILGTLVLYTTILAFKLTGIIEYQGEELSWIK